MEIPEPQIMFQGIKLAKNVTGFVFLSFEGPYSLESQACIEVRRMLKKDRFAKNARAVELLGKFDVVFGFEVPRFTNYDYVLSSFLEARRLKGVYTVPCAKILFVDEKTGREPRDNETPVFLFIRTDENLVPEERYSNLITIARMLRGANLETLPKNDFRSKLSKLCDPDRVVTGLEAYFTYSLYDLLFVMTVRDPSLIPAIVTNIQDLAKSQIDESVTLIGIPKEQTSSGSVFTAEIFVRVDVGMGREIRKRIKRIFDRNKIKHTFTWRHGYYDLSCEIIMNDLKTLNRLIGKKIRKLPGIKTTATTFSGILSNDIPKGFKPKTAENEVNVNFGSDFAELRDRIWRKIEVRKRDKDEVVKLIAEKQNTLFNHLEQILYRLRYVRFRWSSYIEYLPQTSVFEQLEFILKDSFEFLERSETWDELNDIDYSIESLSRMICNVERAFAQKLESLDIADTIGLHPRGIEKLGGVERILEAMEYVAKDYYSIGSRSWLGMVVCGVQSEGFQAEGDIDFVLAPSFSKYRIKSWPLIAHEIGHQIVPPDRYILEDRSWLEILEDLQSLVDRFPIVFNVGPQTHSSQRQRILREIVAEIYATFAAGTSYIKSLVGHYYVPQFFFNMQVQRVAGGITAIPFSLRIALAEKTLFRLAPNLLQLVAPEEEVSKKAFDREHGAVISHLKLWNKLGKISRRFCEQISKPYGNEIRRVLKTSSAAFKDGLKSMIDDEEVVEAITTALNSIERFCGIQGVYNERVREEALNLHYQEIVNASIVKFLESLEEPSRAGPSLFNRILERFGQAPFSSQVLPDYDALTANIRKKLQDDTIIECQPKYILETFTPDRSRNLNVNSAIISILLSGQKRFKPFDTTKKPDTSHQPT